MKNIRSIDKKWDYPEPDEGQLEWAEKMLAWIRPAAYYFLVDYLNATVYFPPDQLTAGPSRLEIITEHPSGDAVIIVHLVYHEDYNNIEAFVLQGEKKGYKLHKFKTIESVIAFVKEKYHASL